MVLSLKQAGFNALKTTWHQLRSWGLVKFAILAVFVIGIAVDAILFGTGETSGQYKRWITYTIIPTIVISIILFLYNFLMEVEFLAWTKNKIEIVIFGQRNKILDMQERLGQLEKDVRRIDSILDNQGNLINVCESASEMGLKAYYSLVAQQALSKITEINKNNPPYYYSYLGDKISREEYLEKFKKDEGTINIVQKIYNRFARDGDPRLELLRPLNVGGINIGISSEEISHFVSEKIIEHREKNSCEKIPYFVDDPDGIDGWLEHKFYFDAITFAIKKRQDVLCQVVNMKIKPEDICLGQNWI